MDSRTLTIGEIADILDVPTSKLRFWEEKGLFRISKSENGYRNYTTTDLIQIADILFYRNLGIPVKSISNFDFVPLTEYGESLQEIQRQLDEKIREYEHKHQYVMRQQQCYYKLLRLMVRPFIVEEIPFSYVVGWDFREKERILQYIEDPTCYIWYKDTKNSFNDGRKGIIVPELPGKNEPPLLWKKDSKSRFLTFPVKAVIDSNYEGLEAEKEISEVRRQYKTGVYMARHLLNCMEDGHRVEYLQGYLEIFEKDTV